MMAEHPEHYNQVNFYREKFLRKKGILPEIVSDTNKLIRPDTILVCQPNMLRYLKKFHLDTIHKKGNCFLLRVLNN